MELHPEFSIARAKMQIRLEIPSAEYGEERKTELSQLFHEIEKEQFGDTTVEVTGVIVPRSFRAIDDLVKKGVWVFVVERGRGKRHCTHSHWR